MPPRNDWEKLNDMSTNVDLFISWFHNFGPSLFSAHVHGATFKACFAMVSMSILTFCTIISIFPQIPSPVALNPPNPIIYHIDMFPLWWGLPVQTLWHPGTGISIIRIPRSLTSEENKSILRIWTQKVLIGLIPYITCRLICLSEYMGSTMDPVWLYI